MRYIGSERCFMLYLLIAIALIFDFTNGSNDSSNIVATAISSRAISPRRALAMTAVAEFIAPFLFGVAVATTLGKGLIDPAAVSFAGGVGGGDCRHLVESAHAGAGYSVFFVSRIGWGLARGGDPDERLFGSACAWAGEDSDRIVCVAVVGSGVWFPFHAPHFVFHPLCQPARQ